MNDTSTVNVGDFGELLADAYELLLQVDGNIYTKDAVRSWLRNCLELTNGLVGSRQRLQWQLRELLSAEKKSVTLDDPDPLDGLLDEVMRLVDDYANSLPAVRPIDLDDSFAEDEPCELLAKAIYEISSRISYTNDEGWSWQDAPERIRDTLRKTANEIVKSGLVTFVSVSRDEATEEDEAPSGLPPNIPMPPGFSPGGEPDDGRANRSAG